MKQDFNQMKQMGGLPYCPQLDGLRALSVFFVMAVHFFPEGHWATHLPMGELGVRCFFVLSGFLITSLLLHAKQRMAESGHALTLAFRNFYIRRCLRIFPIYYLTVLITWLADVQHVRESLPWLLTYATNILFSLRNGLLWSIGHFWTLSVEEQFYVIWPWVVLLVPTRRLNAVILTAIAISPVFQLCCRIAGPQWYTAMGALPFGSLDSLGLGALLAMRNGNAPNDPMFFKRLIRIGWWVALPMYLVFSLMRAYHVAPFVPRVLSTLVMSLFLVAVVAGTSRGYSGAIGRVLSSAPLRFIGKISYGMYIYHVFMLALVPHLLSHMGLTLPDQNVFRFIVLSASTVAVAAASWFFIEKPINSMKRFFPC